PCNPCNGTSFASSVSYSVQPPSFSFTYPRSWIAMEDETSRKNEMNPPENASAAQEQNALNSPIDDSTTQTTTASKGSKRNAYEPKKKGPEKPLSLFFLPNDFIPSLVPQAQAYFDFQ